MPRSVTPAPVGSDPDAPEPAAPGTAPAPPRLPLAVVAMRLGDELATLAGLAADLQHGIAESRAAAAVGGAATVPPATIRALQGIDRLAQTLDDLARLTRALAAESSGCTCREAPSVSAARLTEGLRLRDLARAMGRAEGAVQQRDGAAPGEVSFF